MANFKNAFRPEDGINLNDIIGIFAGQHDPSLSGEIAPTGSLFIRSTGQLYQKTGINDTDWITYALSGSGVTNLNDVGDVQISVPGNGDILTYDSGSGTWYNNPVYNLQQAVLPDQTNNIGNYLTTDGVTASWTAAPSGTVTSINAVAAGTGITVSGSPITSSGTLTFALADDVLAIENLSSTGIATRINTNMWVTRQITGISNQVLINNGDGVAGNISIALADNPHLPGSAGIVVPTGTTMERSGSPSYGELRINTDTGNLEVYTTEWVFYKDSTTMAHEQEPTGFVNRVDSTVSFNESTRVFTITPVASNFVFYVHGVRHVKTAAESITLSNIDGPHYIYYDGVGNLVEMPSIQFLTHVICFYVYWDSANNQATVTADERHGITMDAATHSYLHNSFGTQYISGLNIKDYTTSGTGTLNSDATFGIDNGLLFDEDIPIPITHSTTPTLPLQQILTPIAKTSVIYRTGPTLWSKTASSDYPVYPGSSRIMYNSFSAGTWGITEASEDAFVAAWIFSTNDQRGPIVSFLGQREDSTLAAAVANNTIANLDLMGFPVVEFKPLYRLIFQTSSTYTNDIKARLVDVMDIRAVKVSSVAIGTSTDHSTLSNLSADDHPQYVHTSVDRVITAVHTFAPNAPGAPFQLDAAAQDQLVNGFNADLLDGFHASSFQHVDTTLTALSTFNSNGLMTQTSADTFTSRTLTAGSPKIAVINGDGFAGDPTVDLGAVALDDLSDVNAGTPSIGDRLFWNGTEWIPGGGAGGGGGLRTWSGNIASSSGTTVYTPGTAAPLITGGTEIVTQTINPISTLSRFTVQIGLSASASTNNNVHTCAVFRTVNGVSTYLGGAIQTFATGGNSGAISVCLSDLPATTSAVTYSIRYGTNSGTWYLNRRVSENTYGGVRSGWEIQEY